MESLFSCIAHSTHSHTQTLTYTHKHKQTYTRTPTHIQCTHTCTHPHSHPHTHTHAHTRTYIYRYDTSSRPPFWRNRENKPKSDLANNLITDNRCDWGPDVSRTKPDPHRIWIRLVDSSGSCSSFFEYPVCA